ncbi:MAG: TspO/MBR family protein [Lutispora sp.]
MDRTKKAWINGFFFVVTLAINTLGAMGLINGLSQKQISDMYVTLITPSPATFSIWSVIYSLLLISVIVMIAKKDDSYYHSAVDQITVLFRISCVLNIAWIVAFSYVQIELSVLFILGFVITLSLICQKLLKIQDGKRWLLPLSFGIYTGWLFIATVVNIAAALVKLKWNGFGIAEDIWAIIIIIIAVLLVILVLSKNRNAAFPLPVAWAYLGIYQYLNAPEGFKGEFGLLQTIALAGMAVLIGVAAIQLYRNHFSLLPNSSGLMT